MSIKTLPVLNQTHDTECVFYRLTICCRSVEEHITTYNPESCTRQHFRSSENSCKSFILWWGILQTCQNQFFERFVSTQVHFIWGSVL